MSGVRRAACVVASLASFVAPPLLSRAPQPHVAATLAADALVRAVLWSRSVARTAVPGPLVRPLSPGAVLVSTGGGTAAVDAGNGSTRWFLHSTRSAELAGGLVAVIGARGASLVRPRDAGVVGRIVLPADVPAIVSGDRVAWLSGCTLETASFAGGARRSVDTKLNNCRGLVSAGYGHAFVERIDPGAGTFVELVPYDLNDISRRPWSMSDAILERGFPNAVRLAPEADKVPWAGPGSTVLRRWSDGRELVPARCPRDTDVQATAVTIGDRCYAGEGNVVRAYGAHEPPMGRVVFEPPGPGMGPLLYAVGSRLFATYGPDAPHASATVDARIYAQTAGATRSLRPIATLAVRRQRDGRIDAIRVAVASDRFLVRNGDELDVWRSDGSRSGRYRQRCDGPVEAAVAGATIVVACTQPIRVVLAGVPRN